MTPIPKDTPSWLIEIRGAYADAEIEVAKQAKELGYTDLFPPYLVAPETCALIRGLPVGDAAFKRARKVALDLYELNLPLHPELTALPHLAFAFCYVATHAGFGIIASETAAIVLHFATQFPDLLLPLTPVKSVKPAPRKPAAKASPKIVELIRLTSEFCAAHLDEEYEALCQNLIEKAGRKRVVPFDSGQIASWAAGVIHALCSVNFAFDKTQTPHTTTAAIAAHFGVSINTSSQKSKTLRDMFKMETWGPNTEFSTLHMMEQNPILKLRIL